jgi:hypothetical protein
MSPFGPIQTLSVTKDQPGRGASSVHFDTHRRCGKERALGLGGSSARRKGPGVLVAFAIGSAGADLLRTVEPRLRRS